MARRPGHMRMGGSTHRLLMDASRRLGDMHNVPGITLDTIIGGPASNNPLRDIDTRLITGLVGRRVREHTKEYADESMHRKVVSMGKKAGKRAEAMEMYAPTKD